MGEGQPLASGAGSRTIYRGNISLTDRLAMPMIPTGPLRLGGRMRRLLYISLGLFLCGTSAFGADTSEPAPSKAAAITRMETFATKLFTTVKHLADDVVPLVKAADEELAR